MQSCRLLLRVVAEWRLRTVALADWAWSNSAFFELDVGKVYPIYFLVGAVRIG